ncbi:MAG: bifunctional metallophosphatase/5'-nucleotidase [Candidatus Riflebacteria bacterium]|nr:bifunctional metallophosphatase/5'-nucleotidase [Candidatus Riflebacteria bacterium]
MVQILERFLLWALVCASVGSSRVAGAPADLTILFTHDLHSHILPRTLTTPEGRRFQSGGFARLSSAIREQRSRLGDRVLLVDAGDLGMGTIFQTGFVSQAYELRLLAKMGYDALTLGNHDFDFSPGGVAAMLRTARSRSPRLPAVVCANIEVEASRSSPEGEPKGGGLGGAKGPPARSIPPGSAAKELRDASVQSHVVLERAGLKIGIFGILGKDAAEDAPFAAPIRFVDRIATSRRVIATLRNQERVDLVVCLSHSGTSETRPGSSEDEVLAREAPGIDVIVSGHTHRRLSKPLVVGSTIIVSSGAFGANLGVLSLRVARGGGTTVTSYELRGIDERIAEDPDLVPVIAGFAKQVNTDYFSRFGYRTDEVLATAGFDLESPLSGVDNPRDLGLGNLVTDAYREAVKRSEGDRYEHVHAAIHPLGHLRGSFLAGPITVSDVFQVLSLGVGLEGVPAYPLCAVHVTGAELKDILEVETSIAPAKPDAHLQVSGVTFRYNPHRLPFDRVTAVTVDEADGGRRPLDRQKLYRICVNYYLVKMIGYVSRVSRGILEIKPKNRDGRPIDDVREMLVDAAPRTPGTQELKEWVALCSFLSSFPDTDGDRIPDVPARYRRTAGRIVAVPSWSPVDLVTGGTWITRGALLAAGLVATILGALAVMALRRLRSGAVPAPEDPV